MNIKFTMNNINNRLLPEPMNNSLTQEEINELFPNPTHFLDGEPIPSDYFEKLHLLLEGIDEFTEEMELTELRINRSTNRYELEE